MRNFIMGVKNLLRWAPIIWKDRDWDWWYLAEIMRFKITAMADSIEQARNHSCYEHDVRTMRLCAALLKRLQADDYFGNASKGFTEVTTRAFIHATEQEKQDLEYLGKTLGKHMLKWWN